MTRGGLRLGAGRPAGEPAKTISIRVPVAAVEQWERAAAMRGQKLSAFIRGTVDATTRIRLAMADPKEKR